MRNLFRSFDRFGVEYLLISGQASILYGAALFSEDIDVWIRPTRRNLDSLARALAACRARVYKLTPPLTLRHARRGHGFHFTIPARPAPTFLDVMACPPRVGAFAAACRRAELMQTDWGRIPVVAIEDLIALKKTRRLYDYEVISSLVRILLTNAGRPSKRLLTWALGATFDPEARVEFARKLGKSISLSRCRRSISKEIVALQERDAAYWSPILAELRTLRRTAGLLPEGLRVAPGKLLAVPHPPQ